MRKATQVHRYRHGDVDVLALENGSTVLVAVLEPGNPWLGRRYQAHADDLEPLPMAYFHGETPIVEVVNA